jgi:GNAT superfamily N-acetyltransferase
MDIYLNRTLELGQKIPYGASDLQLQVGEHTYYVGNPSRNGASYPVKIKAGVYCSETEVLNLVAEVQPSVKAHELGYVFKFHAGIAAQEPDRILAYMGSVPNSDPVGELTYVSTGAYLEDQDVQVAPEHRRRGIATAMYQQAESLTGKHFLSRQGEVLPVDAAAFWGSPDRPFGVDSLYSQPKRLLWVNLADLMPGPLKDLPRAIFDADRFTLSASGQRCIDMANSGAGPRVGLQEARVRGLMARGIGGVVESFVSDPFAPPKFVRAVQCAQQPAVLSLCNGKGLPDATISPPLALLTTDSQEESLHLVARHLQALANLDALEVLHPQIRLLARIRTVHHEHGDPEAVERAFEARRTQAISVLTDLLEKEAEFRASQM